MISSGGHTILLQRRKRNPGGMRSNAGSKMDDPPRQAAGDFSGGLLRPFSVAR